MRLQTGEQIRALAFVFFFISLPHLPCVRLPEGGKALSKGCTG
jgi:hypothetical protein